MQAQGIHLRRLIYIREEEYKILKGLRDSLLKRWRRFYGKRPKPRIVVKRRLVGWRIKDDLNGRGGRIYPSYEATRIWATRESMMWKWRRVREYYRDFMDDRDEKAIKEQVYRLIHS